METLPKLTCILQVYQNCRHALCLVFCVCSMVMVACQTAETGRYGAETRLLNELLHGYNNKARPVFDPLDAVNVTVSFNLVQIGDLNAKNQNMHLLGWMEINWKDEYLTWEPSEYGGINNIITDTMDIWRPDVVIYNSAVGVYTDLNSPKFQSSVTPNGSVSWYTSGEVTVNCAVVMTTFPFDQQSCVIELYSWQYSGDQMSLRSLDTSVKMDEYVENGQWEIIETPMETTVEIWEEETYYGVDITIKLKRKPLFYTLNIVLPCLMLSMLVMLVFALPADSGEKVSLGITVLLSFSVFQLLLADVMPETSDTPAISMYLLSLMGLSALSIVVTVIVLSVHHANSEQNPPRWLQRLIPTPKKPEAGGAEDRTQAFSVKEEEPIARSNGASHPSSISPMFPPKDERGLEKVSSMIDMKRDLSTMIGKQRVDERRALVKEKWMAVAKVLDRLFMVLFLLSTLFVTIVLLGIVPNI